MNEIYRMGTLEFKEAYSPDRDALLWYELGESIDSKRMGNYKFMHSFWNGLCAGEFSAANSVEYALWLMECVQAKVQTKEDAQSRPAMVTGKWLQGFWTAVVCDIIRDQANYLRTICVNDAQERMFNNVNAALERDCAGELQEIDGKKNCSYAWEVDEPKLNEGEIVSTFKYLLQKLHAPGGFRRWPRNIWVYNLKGIRVQTIMREWGYMFMKNQNLTEQDAISLSTLKAMKPALEYMRAQYNPFDHIGW